MRALVVGAGPTGHQHAAALRGVGHHVTLADPHQPPADHRALAAVLEDVRPHVATIATPPVPALGLARAAAQTGATVLLEKPGILAPTGELGERVGDERIYLAHEVRFIPVVERLLRDPPSICAAELTLRCWRPPEHHTGWRRQHHTGGGLLHQQAHQALGLLAQLSGPPSWCQTWTGPRESTAVERQVAAELGGAGTEIRLDARNDDVSFAGAPQQLLRLRQRHGPDHTTATTLGGPVLECGLHDAPYGVYQHQLRVALHTAISHVADGGTEHPALLPLREGHPIAALIQHIHRSRSPRSPARTGPTLRCASSPDRNDLIAGGARAG